MEKPTGNIAVSRMLIDTLPKFNSMVFMAWPLQFCRLAELFGAVARTRKDAILCGGVRGILTTVPCLNFARAIYLYCACVPSSRNVCFFPAFSGLVLLLLPRLGDY